MRRFGQFLAALGLVIGGTVCIGLLLPIHLAGIPWLIGLGLVKLAFAASGGLMAGGAVLIRAATRDAERKRVLPKG
jgi:hypothetical protein